MTKPIYSRATEVAHKIIHLKSKRLIFVLNTNVTGRKFTNLRYMTVRMGRMRMTP